MNIAESCTWTSALRPPPILGRHDTSRTCGNGEEGRDGLQGLVDGEDVLRLCVQAVVVHVFVVDAILLAAGDTNLLKKDVGLGKGLAARTATRSRRTISSHCFMGAARFRYLAVVSIFHSTGSSLRSIMWELLLGRQ